MPARRLLVNTTKRRKPLDEAERQRIKIEIDQFYARRRRIQVRQKQREHAARIRYPAGILVGITSCHFKEQVCLWVLSIEPNRGVPFDEDYAICGIDATGGYTRSVAVSIKHGTRVELIP
ncbi:hypothetical protein BK004_03570 [bacterium CG10_46_32]|nr:MAG: hypothetical protein BK004_03570 [bacterium CG10_46_32]PIR55931.1 MAG: hypothetical protein COU73_03600 [Parcubacteria group bacterium CG10_big_fil_rev_8_21_14_0_10_46_32]